MAFDHMMQRAEYSKVDQIEIAVVDKTVRKSLIAWCEKRGYSYIVRTGVNAERKISLSYLYRLMPHTLQSIIYLVYCLLRCWPVKAGPCYLEVDNKPQVSFVSYFFNTDIEGLREGKYISRYWTSLYDFLQSIDNRYNWLHLFVNSKEIDSPRSANGLIRNLNYTLKTKERHQLLDTRISYSVLISTLSDYLKVWMAAFRIRGIKQSSFEIEGSSVLLWPLLANDWKESFFGRTAIGNALYLNRFERAIAELPYQDRGYYLLENQAWERALIYVWRQAGHGSLTGVQHSTVNPCDLRYFFDPTEYHNQLPYSIPMPDKIAVNGDAAKRQFEKGGFPQERLVAVEGLRYLYLDGLDQTPADEKTSDRLRLLVLGDYLPNVTHKLMQLLSDAAEEFPENIEVLVKSHPACTIRQSDWPLLNCKLLDDSLDQLVDSYDVAFTSNVTAAAVDAYLAGKPVLSMLDPETFNMSPLRGVSGVEFVSTRHELIDCLASLASVDVAPIEPGVGQYFYTDSALPRWKQLICGDAAL
jgi:surface carbohydrate biosynthesis protein (TIGR04326 family)